jgi:uncharacterized membrane protein YagU involved in acid resistance
MSVHGMLESILYKVFFSFFFFYRFCLLVKQYKKILVNNKNNVHFTLIITFTLLCI